jgi:hypothetical protein
MKRHLAWVVLLGINVALFCELSFQGSSVAAPAEAQAPFANAVEQRMEMIRELREIRALLQEHNALLRSGQLKVVVVPASR